MSRWKASAIHCCISLLVVSIIAAAMMLTWYPPLLAWAGGQTGILNILFGVDISIGPLLTLLVFKSGKPTLKFDLTVIALLQTMGIGYGLYVLYEARPVYIVFAGNSFNLVTAVDIRPESLQKAEKTPYSTLPLAGPKTVAAHQPKDPAEQMQIALQVLSAGGADIHQSPQYYQPYPEASQEVLKKMRSLEKLMSRDEATRSKLDGWLAGKKREASSVGYLPLYAKIHDLTVLVDSRTAEILDILAIEPS